MNSTDTVASAGAVREAEIPIAAERTMGSVQATIRRMVVIVNPATHGNASAIVDLMHRSAPEEIDLDVRFTQSAGTTTTLTRDALKGEARAVVAVGGDGTVAAVAAALQNTNIPLGVIPGGSTNITARQAGIPADPARAISLLFGSHRHMDHDIGLWGELPFLHMAGAGLDSRLFQDANPATKRRLGWLAYVPPALHDLRDSLARFTIVADGVSVDMTAISVLVANGSAIISPHISLFPGIETDDGWLDILAFTPETPSQALALLASAVTHRLASSHFLTHVRAQHIQIISDPMLPVELDGDVVTQTPVTLTVVPGALRIIVPHR